jgi:hypothetical protein
MFPARRSFRANDQSIQEDLRLASLCGFEGADWRYDWDDAGRVTFSFKDEERAKLFTAIRALQP